MSKPWPLIIRVRVAHTQEKKVREFPVPSWDVTTKLSLGGKNDVITELFLPRGSLVSHIPAGDGKLVNLFLRCRVGLSLGCSASASFMPGPSSNLDFASSLGPLLVAKGDGCVNGWVLIKIKSIYRKRMACSMPPNNLAVVTAIWLCITFLFMSLFYSILT
jgi:hypothetical protein